jgi:hypothetical protein
MHFHPLALGNETSPVAITLPLALEHLVAESRRRCFDSEGIDLRVFDLCRQVSIGARWQ